MERQQQLGAISSSVRCGQRRLEGVYATSTAGVRVLQYGTPALYILRRRPRQMAATAVCRPSVCQDLGGVVHSPSPFHTAGRVEPQQRLDSL